MDRDQFISFRHFFNPHFSILARRISSQTQNETTPLPIPYYLSHITYYLLPITYYHYLCFFPY
ncbi:hypothetical protein COT68_01760 [bacterium (Candidatus Torokbacteria) CG09_land_8_20_14_0_10_42_11]|nr:MAG: hypothetical protein COT68_01760 [bacterium (Candidatus Torokbacteria) CG09_land_8_20_14_0_10_42_11]